jgi:ribose transport system ATP-binding protein
VEPLLSMRNICKTFGATRALQNVDLDVRKGQVHILVGENGAGKSTLMKVLTGVHEADEGEILFQGRPLTTRNPKEALLSGIAMIYQEFNLALHLPVYANIFLGRERAKYGIISKKEQQQKVREIFARLDADIDPNQPVIQLGVAQRQLVEIARALSVDAKLIIMDEPTAALSDKEAQKLFAVIKSLRETGVGIIYISHYLEEFSEIGDVYTVLRDGQYVGSGDIASATHDDLIQMMVGRKIEDLYTKSQHHLGEVLFSLSNLSSPNGTKKADIEVRSGEIVGIAGLVGAGRTEMLRAIMGLDPGTMDELLVKGKSVNPPSPRKLLRHQVGLLSEDRAHEGLAQTLTLADNITMPIPEKISRMGILSLPKKYQISQDVMRQINVKAEHPLQKVNQLSGGNQQKVAISRLVAADTQVMLLDEPTRGIDVGSKAEIYKVIMDFASKGTGIIMVSSYLPELFGMCDSLYVMCRGTLSRKYSINDIDEDKVMALATGISDEYPSGPVSQTVVEDNSLECS